MASDDSLPSCRQTNVKGVSGPAVSSSVGVLGGGASLWQRAVEAIGGSTDAANVSSGKGETTLAPLGISGPDTTAPGAGPGGRDDCPPFRCSWSEFLQHLRHPFLPRLEVLLVADACSFPIVWCQQVGLWLKRQEARRTAC